MKRHLSLFITILIFSTSAFSQKDTITFYSDSNYVKCDKSKAVFLSKIYKKKHHWIKEDFIAGNSFLFLVTSFTDKHLNLLEGTSSYFSKGIKVYDMDFTNGSPVSKTYYYHNGIKKAFMSFDYNVNRSWDEAGNELKNTILIRDAMPFGDSWDRYIIDSANEYMATSSGLKMGNYKMQVGFTIDTTGKLHNLKILSMPDNCFACKEAITRIFENSPQWKPGIENNKPVSFNTTYSMQFYVENKIISGTAKVISWKRMLSRFFPLL